MALYVIADTHLSVSGEKSMEVFAGWQDYMLRLAENWKKIITSADTVVIAGDVSWGMTLKQALEDFHLLNQLPGTKLLLKGNHDYWWETKTKLDRFLAEQGLSTLRILFNDACRVGDIAVCGTRGWFYDSGEPADRKVLLREAGRLRLSIQAAKKLGGEPVVFLHYPPLSKVQRCPELLEVLRQEGVRRCYYGHLHAQSAYHALTGPCEGIRFQLISADFLSFCPVLVPESGQDWRT